MQVKSFLYWVTSRENLISFQLLFPALNGRLYFVVKCDFYSISNNRCPLTMLSLKLAGEVVKVKTTMRIQVENELVPDNLRKF